MYRNQRVEQVVLLQLKMCTNRRLILENTEKKDQSGILLMSKESLLFQTFKKTKKKNSVSDVILLTNSLYFPNISQIIAGALLCHPSCLRLVKPKLVYDDLFPCPCVIHLHTLMCCSCKCQRRSYLHNK